MNVVPAIRVCAFALMACPATVAETANSSYLPGIDFSKYRTYQWTTTRPHPDGDVDAAIRQVIDSNLAAKGLSKADGGQLILDYHVAMSSEERWPPFRYNEIDANATPITVYAGTLGLEMRDAALKQSVWKGLVAKAVNPQNSAAAKRKNLDRAVQQLLKAFPPKQAK